MARLVRLVVVVGLVLTMVVVSGRFGAVEASEPVVRAVAAGCANSEVTATGSATLCIAEMPRSTRGYVNGACITAPKALVLMERYERTECKGAGNGGASIEAIAQARAIARLNAAGLYGKPVPASGISADLQWEVRYPGGRPDIVSYDRKDPGSPIRLIEVKKSSGASAADRQVARYVRNFPPGPLSRRVERWGVSGYLDFFQVRVASCDTVGARFQVVDTYRVSAAENDGILLFAKVATDAKPCSAHPEMPPIVTEPPEDEPVDEYCSDGCVLPAPGSDSDGDGHDDFWEDFLDHHPELADLPVWPALPTPTTTGTVTVVAEAAAVLVAAALICVAVESACPWIARGLVAAVSDSGTLTLQGAIAALLAGIGSYAGWTVWGDPHMVTIDGRTYDLQSVGEFTLAQVPTTGLDVQARFAPLRSPGGDPSTRVSLLGPLATEVADDRVELGGADPVLVDGEPANLTADDIVELGDQSFVAPTPKGQVVVDLSTPEAPVVVQREGIHVRVAVPPGVPTAGLVGDNDQDPSDDLRLRDGSAPPSSGADPVWLHRVYADSWRIDDLTSLFTYAAGESTATFTDETFPADVVKVSDLSQAVRDAAASQCTAAGVVPGPQFDSCVLDVGLTSDAGFAGDAALIDQVLVDSRDKTFDGAGRLVEDFEGSVGPNFDSGAFFGDPATTKLAGPIFDQPGYRFHVGSIPRSDLVKVGFDLVVLGPVTTDAAAQRLRLAWDDGKESVIGFDTATPMVGGTRAVALLKETTGSTADGKAFTRYRVSTSVPGGSADLSLAFAPENFRGVIGTALAVDDIDLSLQTPPAQVFDGTFPLVVPGPVGSAFERTKGAGLLESRGAQDSYRFALASTSTLLLDHTECATSAAYRLVEVATGKVVATRYGCTRDQVFPDLASGSYRLDVAVGDTGGTPDLGTGRYGFRLERVPAAETFSYVVGSDVSAGNPAAGAGVLETVASEDRYTFTLGSGGSFEMDQTNGYWAYRIADTATGAVVVRGWGDGPVDLPAGSYAIEFGYADGVAAAKGSYGFRFFPVPLPQTFAYTVGTQVRDGVPRAGAGNLETVASMDRYAFTVPSGGGTYRYSAAIGTPVHYQLKDAATGAEVASGWNQLQLLDLSAGSYVLEISATTRAGTYSFTLSLVPEPQSFAYTLGRTVSDGVPAAGAGNLETNDSIDIYRFTVPEGAGGSYQYEQLSGYKGYTIVDRATGDQVATGTGVDVRHTLPVGSYRIEYRAAAGSNPAGTYSFRLFKVPPVQKFRYRIGATVSEGVPAAGAGNIETIASVDQYTFTVLSGAGGAHRYLQLSGHRPWKLVNTANGSTVATGDGYEDKRFTIGAGKYRITFAGDTSLLGTGTYSFKIRSVA